MMFKIACLGGLWLGSVAAPPTPEVRAHKVTAVTPSSSQPYELLWRQPLMPPGRTKVAREVVTQAAISRQNHVVIVATPTGDVIAYQLQTGRRVWGYHYGMPFQTSATMVSTQTGDMVLLGTRDGHLLALNAKTGRQLWLADLDGEMRSNAQMARGMLFVATSSNKVSAIDPSTGQVIWTHGRMPPAGLSIDGHAQARIVGDKVITGFSDGFAAAFAMDSGEILWSRPLALHANGFLDVDADPCIVADTVVMASYAGGIYALDIEDGHIRWQKPMLQISSLVATEQQVIAGDADGQVSSINPATGACNWQTHLPSAPISRFVLDGDDLVFAAGNLGLIVLDAKNGKPKQSAPVGERIVGDLTKVGPYLAFVSAPGQLYLWQHRPVAK